MKRAMFTVVVREVNATTSYCANDLSIHDGPSGRQELSFICSGKLQTVLVGDVVEVELTDGWSHCFSCDQPLANLSYGPEKLKVLEDLR
jgi:hypothetical protein